MPVVTPVPSGEKARAIISNGLLVSGNLGANAVVRIYNIHGRLITTLPVNRIVNLRSAVAPGCYIVRVTADRQRFTLKYLVTQRQH